MNGTKRAAASAILLLALGTGFAAAEEAPPSAAGIVESMDRLLFCDGKADMTLTFVDEKGRKDVYAMTTYAQDRNQRIIVRFRAPAAMVGNDILMLERNVWAYDAATTRILKIPSNQGFGGTGFSYGDILRLNFEDNYVATIAGVLPGGGWSLDLQAKERDAPYFRIKLDVDASFMPLRGVCLGRSGDVIKEMKYSGVRDAGAGRKPLVITVTSPLEPGRVSTLAIVTETRKNYPESVFNKRNLSARLEEQY